MARSIRTWSVRPGAKAMQPGPTLRTVRGSRFAVRGSRFAVRGPRAARSAHVVRENETPARAASRQLEDGAVELVDYSEALRRKENYLALLRQLEYEEKSAALIELAV